MEKKKDLQLLNSKLLEKMAGKSNTDIKLEKRKFIWSHLPHRKKAMTVLTSIQKAAAMEDRIPFLNNGTVMSSSVSGEQTGQIL